MAATRERKPILLVCAVSTMLLTQSCSKGKTYLSEDSPGGEARVRIIETRAKCGSEPCFGIQIGFSGQEERTIFGQTGAVCFAGVAWSKTERKAAIILSICHGSPVAIAYDLERKTSVNFLAEHEEMLRQRLQGDYGIEIQGSVREWVGSQEAWDAFTLRSRRRAGE